MFYFVILYLILVFTGIVIGGRNLDSTVLQKYNSAGAGEVEAYNLTPYDLIPVSAIRSGTLQTGYTYNDPSLWRFQFIQIDAKEENAEIIESITCDKYIEKYLGDLNSEQRDSIDNQLGGFTSDFICPDTDMIVLEGNGFLT